MYVPNLYYLEHVFWNELAMAIFLGINHKKFLKIYPSHQCGFLFHARLDLPSWEILAHSKHKHIAFFPDQMFGNLSILVPVWFSSFLPIWKELFHKLTNELSKELMTVITKRVRQGIKLTRLMSIFTYKKVWKFFIKIQLTKSDPKRTRGWKVPCLMPIKSIFYKLFSANFKTGSLFSPVNILFSRVSISSQIIICSKFLSQIA